jgi:TPR repeat protein
MTIADEERLAGQAIEAAAFEQAVVLLRPLAERQSDYALLTLGWIYETGATGAVDQAAAQSLYEQAAIQGSAAGYLRLGWLLLSKGEDMVARTAFEAGARLDNDECKSALAQLADHDIERLAARAIEDKEYAKAVALLRPLAERQSEYALLALGWICDTGSIGPSDKQAARFHYERAVDRGSVTGYLELGRLLVEQGEETRARALFATGADLGNISCMATLGEMMVEGSGGDIDPVAGYRWLEKAAAHDHIFAKRALLGREARNARSLFSKFSTSIRIMLLSLRGGREMQKNPYSEKVR